MKALYRTLLVIAALIAGSMQAHASMIGVTLVEETLVGKPLDVLVFHGTLTNSSGGDIFVSGATLSLAGFGPDDGDLLPFILNASGPLGAGNTIGPVDFFTITIPGIFPSGQYPGLFTIQGGLTENDDSVLGTVTFQVDVQAVPEPATVALFAVGGLAFFVKKLLDISPA